MLDKEGAHINISLLVLQGNSTQVSGVAEYW